MAKAAGNCSFYIMALIILVFNLSKLTFLEIYIQRWVILYDFECKKSKQAMPERICMAKLQL